MIWFKSDCTVNCVKEILGNEVLHASWISVTELHKDAHTQRTTLSSTLNVSKVSKHVFYSGVKACMMFEHGSAFALQVLNTYISA